MLLGKNHRHTGMDLGDEFIRLACDDRAGAQPLSRFRIFPVFSSVPRKLDLTLGGVMLQDFLPTQSVMDDRR
jgi:hypothetical protein